MSCSYMGPKVPHLRVYDGSGYVAIDLSEREKLMKYISNYYAGDTSCCMYASFAVEYGDPTVIVVPKIYTLSSYSQQTIDKIIEETTEAKRESWE